MVRLSNVLQFGLGVSAIAAQAEEGLHRRIVFKSHESRSVPNFLNDIGRLHRSVKRARSVVEDRDVAVKVPEEELKSILTKLQELEKQVEGLLPSGGSDVASATPSSGTVSSSGSSSSSADQNCDAESLLYSLGANASKDASGKVSDHPMFKNANCSMDAIVSGQSKAVSASQTVNKQLPPVPTGFLNSNEKDSSAGTALPEASPSASVSDAGSGSNAGSGAGSGSSNDSSADASETTGSTRSGALAPDFGGVKAAVAGFGSSAGSGDVPLATGGAEAPGNAGPSPLTGAPASGDLTTTVITRTRHSTITITLARGQAPPTGASEMKEKLKQAAQDEDGGKTMDGDTSLLTSPSTASEVGSSVSEAGSTQDAAVSSASASALAATATSGKTLSSPSDDRKFLNGTIERASNMTSKGSHSHKGNKTPKINADAEMTPSASSEVMLPGTMSTLSANNTGSQEHTTASIADEFFNSTVSSAHMSTSRSAEASPAAKSRFVANLIGQAASDSGATSTALWTGAETSLTSLSVAPYTPPATTTADPKTDFIGAAFKNDTSGFRTVMVRGSRRRHEHPAL